MSLNLLALGIFKLHMQAVEVVCLFKFARHVCAKPA